MASPLADVDWTDLDSAEMTTAVKLILVGLQERANLTMVRMDGTYNTLGTPSDQTVSNYFPYGNNTPIYTLNDGDPLIDFTNEVEDLIQKCMACADIEKWDDADANSEGNLTQYRLSGVADDPGTYDNRLFEITGYTSYPDLSVYAPEEVKKAYDMMVEFKYIIRAHGIDNDDYMIFNGEFDVEEDSGTLVSNDVDGADWYGISDKDNGDPVGTTAPYTDFKAGNNNLFDSGSASYNEDTDSGTYPPNYQYPYRLRFTRYTGSGNYVNWLSAFRVTYVADWTDVKAAVGNTGQPISYQNQQNMRGLVNLFPTGEDTNWSWPKSTTGIAQRYYTDITLTVNGDKDEIEVDDDLSPVTLPTNITDIAAGEQVRITADYANTFRNLFLEYWNADGGFEYFTPP